MEKKQKKKKANKNLLGITIICTEAAWPGG